MINKENIELKIFEFHEGELSPIEMEEVEQFVNNHPEYLEDFNAFAKSKVSNEELLYKHANELLVGQGMQGRSILKWGLSGGLFLISLISFGLFTQLGDNNVKSGQLANNEISDDNNKLNNNNLDKNSNSYNNQTSNNNTLSVNDQNIDSNYDLNNNIINNQGKNSREEDSKIVNLTNNKSKFNTSNSLALNNASLNNNNVNQTNNTSALNQENYTENVYKNGKAYASQLNNKKGLENKNLTPTEIAAGNKAQLLLSNIFTPNKAKYRYKDIEDKRLSISNNKDPYYANEEGTYLSINPSFAGNTDGVRMEYFYRTEWPTINQGNYVTQIVTLDGYVDAIKSAVGIIYEDDVIGHNQFNTRSVGVYISPKIKVTNFSIEPSARLTNTSRSIQWSQVSSSSLIDPRTGFKHIETTSFNSDASSSSISYNNIGFGILINHDKFFIGGSFDQLNNVSYNFDGRSQTIDIPNTLSIQAGTEIKANKNSKVSYAPSVNYIQIGEWDRLWLINQFKMNNFMLGFGTAVNNAYIFNAGYTSKKVRLVYSYGLSKPPINGDNFYGSHQINLRINFLPVK